MESSEIEEFAQILIKQVKDRTIVNCDSQLKENSNSPNIKRWRELNSKDNVELVKAVIADCLDLTIANFLSAIDNKSLNLRFISKKHNEADLTKSNDELTGWYMGSGEWREKYSKERFFDNFKV